MASFINSTIEEIVKTYADLVMRELKVSSIYLYGSYAKGNYSEDSDFDISDPYVQEILRTGIKIM